MNNCVCSQYKGKFYIEPIKIKENVGTIGKIADFIKTQKGYEIKEATDSYLHVTFTSKIMKFVDDIEFLIEGKQTVHIRSASRLGNWDLGANRKRVQYIKSKLSNIM